MTSPTPLAPPVRVLVRQPVFSSDIISFVCLLLAAWKVVFSAARVLDIRLYDESDYLFAGLRLARGEGLHAVAAQTPTPLYALWYDGLHALAPDPLALYVLNFQILTAAVTLALYAVLRRAGTSPLLSLLTSLLYLVSGLPLIWPRVTHLALLVLLGTLLTISFLRTRTTLTAALAIGLLVMSYIRAEYVPAFVLACALLLWEMIRGRRFSPPLFLPLFAVVGAGIVLWAVFGGPPPAGDSSRAFAAFSQHFAVHYVRLHHSPLNPWTEAPGIIAGVFGPVHTVGGALRANPAAFAGYCMLNLALLPVGAAKALLAGLSKPAIVLLAGILLAACVVLWRGRTFSSSSTPYPIYWRLTVLLVSVPTALSVLLVYPDPHYLLPLLVLLLIGGVRRLDRLQTALSRVSPHALTVLAVAAVLLAPPFSSRWYKWTPPQTPYGMLLPMETRRTVEFLRTRLPSGTSQRILEADGGYNIYLGPECTRVAETDKDRPFSAFIAAQHVTAVVASPLLLHDSRFAGDPQFTEFQSHSDRWDFVRLDVPGTHQTLYVKTGRSHQ